MKTFFTVFFLKLSTFHKEIETFITFFPWNLINIQSSHKIVPATSSLLMIECKLSFILDHLLQII